MFQLAKRSAMARTVTSKGIVLPHSFTRSKRTASVAGDCTAYGALLNTKRSA